MDVNEFLTGFVEQFEDTEPDEITINSRFKDLEEWGSLTALSIIAFVRTTYGKTITGNEIRSCETVRDLYDLVSIK